MANCRQKTSPGGANVCVLMKQILLFLIKLYQNTLSRALPPSCRFTPSCSHYGYEAIQKYGAMKGGYMAVRRILRCHPFNPGGYDPVP